MAQNALFPYFSELFLVFLLKHPSEQYRLSQWVKENFFLLGGAPRGSRNSPNYPKIAFMSRFAPICWDIFHKLLLNCILKSIIVPLKLFFKLLWARKWPKIGPKCPFSLFLGIIFGVFAKTFLRTVQTSTMGHSLKFPAKEIFFAVWGSQWVQNQPKLTQNCIFVV